MHQARSGGVHLVEHMESSIIVLEDYFHHCYARRNRILYVHIWFQLFQYIYEQLKILIHLS